MKKINQNGITIIEILIYVGLLTTVLALITNFFYQVAVFRINQQISGSLMQNSSLVFSKLNQDIMEASAIIIPNSSNFTNNLSLQTLSGIINYQINNKVLYLSFFLIR